MTVGELVYHLQWVDPSTLVVIDIPPQGYAGSAFPAADEPYEMDIASDLEDEPPFHCFMLEPTRWP